VAAACVSEI